MRPHNLKCGQKIVVIGRLHWQHGRQASIVLRISLTTILALQTHIAKFGQGLEQQHTRRSPHRAGGHAPASFNVGPLMHLVALEPL